jgi:hypothetical protein
MLASFGEGVHIQRTISRRGYTEWRDLAKAYDPVEGG